MQEGQSIYQKMNEVLSGFRKVPTLFEEFLKDSNPEKLNHVLQIAGCLMSIDKARKAHGEAEVQLFHRFYCRMREVIYSYLNFYINSNSYMFIRDFLVQVNKSILKFRPDTNPTTIIKEISNLIVLQVKKLANMRNVGLHKIQPTIQELAIQTSPTEENDYAINTVSSSVDTARFNRKIKRANSFQNSLIRQLGLNIIPDLERRQVDNLRFISQEQLMRDCLNRNKAIQNQINRYNQLYKSYINRSPKKKNSSYLHFKPTIYTPNPSSPCTPKKTPTKEYRQLSFNKKRANLYEPVPFQNAEVSEEKLKEEVLSQIYETRQKICLKKVVVIGTDLTFRPISATQNKKVNSSQTSRWTRPRSVHKSKVNKNVFSMSLSVRKN